MGFYRDRAKRRGTRGGRTGTVTFIQRFGGALNVNPHFHTLVLDGVFVEGTGGEIVFHPAAPPTDREVAELLAVVHRRVVRLLERRGLLSDEPARDETDDLFERSPALAGCYSASIGHTSALSDRAGQRVRRLGVLRHPPANDIALGRRRARFDGFDLHADVAVPARDRDRARLERLCRYTARPSVSNERLERRADGSIVLNLKAPWSDGTEQILLEPLELLERLAALVPRPRTNLVLYHGVLAPNAKWRSRVVRHGRESLAPERPERTPQPTPSPTPAVVTPSTRRRRPGRVTWLSTTRCRTASATCSAAM